jgi:2,4-dienoyl-CoA reductase-like NADH-dependent reductase (Old Yellow Enzyme family)
VRAVTPPPDPSARPVVPSAEPRDPFAPARLGPLTLRNRFVKSATNEGMAHGGLVSDGLVEYHRRPAAGGVAMTTLAYFAVSSEGRTYRDQLFAREEVRPGLRRLTDAVHAEGAAVAVQLAHAGWFANPRATGERAIGPTRMFSPYGMGWPRAMRADDFARILDAYRSAARLLADCGFDALEIHMGHGYLLSQFLSPYTNRRSDEYGGPLENRARFPREVARVVRDEIGSRAAVYAKLNMDDGFSGGLSLADGVAVARLLESDGALDALQLTGGFTAKTPMYLMRGGVPMHEIVAMQPTRLRRFGMRLFAPSIMKAYPFEEAFFLPNAREVRRAVSMPLMLLGGVKRLDTIRGALAEGFDFIALARALLREPDLVERFRTGRSTESLCSSCNRCVVEMERVGTRCVEIPAQ